ncbi:type IV pilus modification protein PilV [Polaromonas jejuensis]|uniref:Type IV pilus modification protein PilV n=1 Tax=Polaromonas jejuensis TaxID=457502 RepID=A0ABW0Q9D8_9BURK|nr:type IV pilus modification protein PilV [Polaromonas jejuensis]
MTPPLPRASQQTGSMLIEVLIALLIFSVGILGIVGLQASAVKAMSDAKYRSEAALLANELIGKMWVSDRTQATLQTAFASPNGTAYLAWLGSASAKGTVLQTLPGAGVQANPPTVTITPVVSTSLPSSLVTITIFWQAPNETSSHNYVVVAQIGG